MSVVKMIDDYFLKFGNERFMDGWNGKQEQIINLLEKHAIQVDEGGGCECKSRCPNIMNDFDYQNHLLALIKGEGK